MSDSIRSLFVRASDQFGVIGPLDLAATGVSRRSALAVCRRGALEVTGTNTFRVAGSPATWEQQLLIAVVDYAPALVSHRSNAALHGFDGFPRKPLEIVTNRDSGWDKPGVIRHRTNRIDQADRCMVGLFHVTSAARTIIDLCAVVSKRELERAVDSSVRDRLCTEEYLRRRLFALRCRGRRGVRLLDEVLDGRGGARFDSELERVFGDLVALCGLGIPRTQLVFRANGRLLRIDVYFVDADLMVEVSGHRNHSTRLDRAADAKRHRAITERGGRWIEFTSDEVFFESDSVIEELRRHLAQLRA